MIPLIALFLITLQLIVTVNYRNLDMTLSQNKASRQAIDQIIDSEDELVQLDSGDRFSNLRLLVVKTERLIPQIFPGVSSLIGGKRLKTSGSAIMEESPGCSGGYLIC